MLCTYNSYALFVNILCQKYSHDILCVNKYSHVHIYIYIYIYIVCTKIFLKKPNSKYLIFFFTKKLTFELKSKCVSILWIGGVGCLTPSPLKTELPSLKSLVQDFGLT